MPFNLIKHLTLKMKAGYINNSSFNFKSEVEIGKYLIFNAKDIIGISISVIIAQDYLNTKMGFFQI